MKKIFIVIICLLNGNMLIAQHARFITSGSIEFEKTINMYAVKRQEMGPEADASDLQAYDQYKKTNPQFKKLTSTLIFGDNKTLYTPVSSPDNILTYGKEVMGMQFNTVYNDLNTNMSTIQKEVYGTFFLLKDTTRKIKWKVTDETRVIAGYNCRRANGIILDSVYVVAFYSDKIWVGAGPESFNGLPGMILGVALPHENVTWYATKVTDMTITPTSLQPPKKGKVVNSVEMQEAIRKANNATKPIFFYRRKVFML